MPRFDVYANRGGSGWLLDVQTDMIHGLETRLVVPLIPTELVPRLDARRLNPAFLVDQTPVVMATQYMAAVPSGILREPEANLSSEQDRIKAALDMIFLGF